MTLHANLAALEAVLDHVQDQETDGILQVGDVVGYGAAPGQSIALIREVGALVVKGNHDAACVGELDTRTFNPNARAAVEFTKTQLSAEDCRWLRALPMVAEAQGCRMAHATFSRPERFDYIQSTDDADPSLDALDAVTEQDASRTVCFLGHTHVPGFHSAFSRVPRIDLLHPRPGGGFERSAPCSDQRRVRGSAPG